MDRIDLAHVLTHIFGGPIDAGFGTLFIGGPKRITIYDVTTYDPRLDDVFIVGRGAGCLVFMPRRGVTLTGDGPWAVQFQGAPWGTMALDGALDYDPRIVIHEPCATPYPEEALEFFGMVRTPDRLEMVPLPGVTLSSPAACGASTVWIVSKDGQQRGSVAILQHIEGEANRAVMVLW